MDHKSAVTLWYFLLWTRLTHLEKWSVARTLPKLDVGVTDFWVDDGTSVLDSPDRSPRTSISSPVPPGVELATELEGCVGDDSPRRSMAPVGCGAGWG